MEKNLITVTSPLLPNLDDFTNDLHDYPIQENPKNFKMIVGRSLQITRFVYLY